MRIGRENDSVLTLGDVLERSFEERREIVERIKVRLIGREEEALAAYGVDIL